MRHGSEDTAAPRGVGDVIGLEVAAVLTGTGPSVYLLNRLTATMMMARASATAKERRDGTSTSMPRWPDEQASDASARSERRA
jgi:hypothetical protein